ncbi:hypothetical protein BT93_D0450 [Corymbia citriodora subsp. variegata]|nr:hypothetical protein BT93_D0450 [Corymbia citriodora subsp. variegata]
MEISADNPASIIIEGLNIENLREDRREKHRLIESIQEKIESSPWQSSECCIFRVPPKLWRDYKEAYTPRIVAIGPYHRGNQSLKPMESHKLLYLHSFLRNNPERSLHDYIERIESWMIRTQSCYHEQINLSNDEFTEMMLLDGIFMIHVFLIYWNPKWRPDGDRIFARPWILNHVRRDMMLLENQMPFFAVQGLFEMAFGSHQEHMPGLLQLVYQFFEPVTMIEVPGMVIESDVKHWLDAIRFSYMWSVRTGPSEMQKEIKFIPNATDLVGAGVKLRRSRSKCLFDIKFKNGVLEIPPLNLYDMTESYFRNVIAFEQRYYEDDSCLIDYLLFIDHLVNTPADAKLLIDKEIIDNWIGSEDAAADRINRYCKDAGLLTRNTYFDGLRHELIEYCRRPRNKWKASFNRDYCSSPWAVLSVVAAVVLLALTVVQTVCSLLSMK